MSKNNAVDLKSFCEVFHNLLMKEYKYNTKKFENSFHKDRPYTKLIQKIMNSITVHNRERDGKNKKGNSEFYTIDHTWWDNKLTEVDNNVDLYDWKLLAAVEHENDKKNWTYEVEKLDSIKAPLKIVIAYLPNNLREDDNEKRIIEKQYQYLHNLDNNEQFGIILMNRKLTESKDPFEMKCYILREEKVEECIFDKEV